MLLIKVSTSNYLGNIVKLSSKVMNILDLKDYDYIELVHKDKSVISSVFHECSLSDDSCIINNVIA